MTGGIYISSCVLILFIRVTFRAFIKMVRGMTCWSLALTPGLVLDSLRLNGVKVWRLFSDVIYMFLRFFIILLY